MLQFAVIMLGISTMIFISGSFLKYRENKTKESYIPNIQEIIDKRFKEAKENIVTRIRNMVLQDMHTVSIFLETKYLDENKLREYLDKEIVPKGYKYEMRYSLAGTDYFLTIEIDINAPRVETVPKMSFMDKIKTYYKIHNI